MTTKRADLEDLEQAQEEEQAEADAIAETEVTPMTTRPHQMPNNSEEEDRFDKGEGSSPNNVEPEEGESEGGEPEDDTEGMPFDDEGDTEGTPEESDDEDDSEDDDMPDFMKEEALIPVVCRACTRKFSMNQVKLGLRCICGSDDLDLDDDEDEGTDSGDSSDYTGASPTTSKTAAITCQGCNSELHRETEEETGDEFWVNSVGKFFCRWTDSGLHEPYPHQASKTALEVDNPDAEIPAPGGAVGDTPIPPTEQPASSDSPQAEELPDNQQFAEPFTEDDGEAVEEKVEAIAKDIFKSQGVSRRQALLLAHKVVAEFPVITVKSSRRTAALFGSPEANAANPPESWQVIRVQKPYMSRPRWHLVPQGAGEDDTPMQGYDTKWEAEQAKTQGFFYDLWHKENRWFNGESIPGWKDYEG